MQYIKREDVIDQQSMFSHNDDDDAGDNAGEHDSATQKKTRIDLSLEIPNRRRGEGENDEATVPDYLSARGSGRYNLPSTAAGNPVASSSTPMALAATPTSELENFMMLNSPTFVNSTALALTPTGFLNPTMSCTEQQAQYSQGFIDALHRLRREGGGIHAERHLSNKAQAAPVAHCGGGGGDSASTIATGDPASDDEENESIADGYDDEPQPPEDRRHSMTSRASSGPPTRVNSPSSAKRYEWDPHSPPKLDQSTIARMSPVERQAYRAARKRARNREAAARCRDKKLRRQADLETIVLQLSEENTSLNTQLFALRKELSALKEKIMGHVHMGCKSILVDSSLLTAR
ncbi:transcription factor Jun-like [Oscarella lobularis]|uniref:transcription factor Jun-like n=1 Tax=Oscarella lobularis TaxID=121494 RepID=UPI003313B271